MSRLPFAGLRRVAVFLHHHSNTCVLALSTLSKAIRHGRTLTILKVVIEVGALVALAVELGQLVDMVIRYILG